MSILELARKTFARLKAERNGHAESPVCKYTDCAKSVLSAKSHLPSSAPAFRLIRDSAELPAVSVALDNTVSVALDTETTGLNPHSDRIRLLSLATDTTDGGRFTYLVDCFAVNPRSLFPQLAARTVVGHNLAFDLGFLAALGFEPGAVCDTMLLSQLLYGIRQPAGFHKLETCVQRELGQTLDKTLQQSDWSAKLSSEQLAYAAVDVAHLHRLAETLDAKIRAIGLKPVAEIESRCLPAIVWLSQAGVAFDMDSWNALAITAQTEVEHLRGQLDEQAPDCPGRLPGASAWNWNSPADVKAVFAGLGSQLEHADDDALAAVNHPLAELLRRYRSAGKRVGTYGRDWSQFVQDGRIHPRWRQIGAESGRMSCSEPNLQNLPRDPAYRRCFTAPAGRVLVKADYSQIELRIAAKIAGDKALLEAYQRGEDLHARTARNVLKAEQVTQQHRQLAKALNFGLLYGMGAKGFRQYAKSQYGLDLSEQEARQYREAFFRSYPGLAAWHQRVRSQRASETRTLTGRRRLLDSKTADTQRLNTPVQGTGADGIKLALALLWERREQAAGAFPVLTAHDEIVVEADAGNAEAVAGWLRQAMLDALTPWIKPVPVEVEVKQAPTWGG